MIYMTVPSKTEWGTATALIAEFATPKDAIVVPDWDFMAESFDRYYKGSAGVIRIPVEGSWHRQPEAEEIETGLREESWRNVAEKHNRLYLIARSDSEVSDLTIAIRGALNEICESELEIASLKSGKSMFGYLGYYHPINILRYDGCIASSRVLVEQKSDQDKALPS